MLPIYKSPSAFAVAVHQSNLIDFVDKFVLDCPSGSILRLKHNYELSEFVKQGDNFLYDARRYDYDDQHVIMTYASDIDDGKLLLTLKDMRSLISSGYFCSKCVVTNSKGTSIYIVDSRYLSSYQKPYGYFNSKQLRVKTSSNVFHDLHGLWNVPTQWKITTHAEWPAQMKQECYYINTLIFTWQE